MSALLQCERCGADVDGDADPDCRVYVGNMRRLHQTKIYCHPCRDTIEAEEDRAINAEPSGEGHGTS